MPHGSHTFVNIIYFVVLCWGEEPSIVPFFGSKNKLYLTQRREHSLLATDAWPMSLGFYSWRCKLWVNFAVGSWPWRAFLKDPEELSGPKGIFLISFVQILSVIFRTNSVSVFLKLGKLKMLILLTKLSKIEFFW